MLIIFHGELFLARKHCAKVMSLYSKKSEFSCFSSVSSHNIDDMSVDRQMLNAFMTIDHFYCTKLIRVQNTHLGQQGSALTSGCNNTNSYQAC